MYGSKIYLDLHLNKQVKKKFKSKVVVVLVSVTSKLGTSKKKFLCSRCLCYLCGERYFYHIMMSIVTPKLAQFTNYNKIFVLIMQVIF